MTGGAARGLVPSAMAGGIGATGVVLGVNVDHVATVRNARYPRDGGAGASPVELAEPDPVRAAHEAEVGGASIITAHLREDRRHVVDRDIELLLEMSRVKFNLEMGASEEMVRIACRLRPHMATIVPEGRREVTTEGGLDVAGQRARIGEMVRTLRDAGVRVSGFIDPDERQVDACAQAGFDACELHTGAYAHAFGRGGGLARTEREAPMSAGTRELARVVAAAARVRARGLQLNAGHGLNYANVRPIALIEGMAELHIGHAIVARAMYVGMREAVGQMYRAMRA